MEFITITSETMSQTHSRIDRMDVARGEIYVVHRTLTLFAQESLCLSVLSIKKSFLISFQRYKRPAQHRGPEGRLPLTRFSKKERLHF
jgi:hypothetical protein